MVQRKKRMNGAVLGAAISAALGLIQSRATAATQEYFDANSTGASYGLTNGATYSWDDNNWSNGVVGGANATTAWVNDGTSFARFYGGAVNQTYTITVSQDEKNVGMFLHPGVLGVTYNINAVSPSGVIDVQTNNDATDGNHQGFLIGLTSAATEGTDSIVINAPITGPGGIVQQQFGALSLFGSNSFAGGFRTTGGQVTNYNNVNSFGPGTISFRGSGSIQGLVNAGVKGMTIPNTLDFNPLRLDGTPAATGAPGVNFVSGKTSSNGPGAIFSGPVGLYGSGVDIFDAGNPTAATNITQFSGNITGAAGIKIANSGTIIFSGSNSYLGGTTLTGTVGVGTLLGVRYPSELVISNDNNIGGTATNLDFTGGILGISGNTLTNVDSHNGAGNFLGGGFDIQSPTNTFTFNRDLSSNFSNGIIKLGAGTLVLTNNGVGGGTVSVVAGALVLRGDAAQGSIFSGGGSGADIHGRLVFDYTTSGGSNPAQQVLNALTSGYHETTPFSSPNDPLYVTTNDTLFTGTVDATKGLGWRDDGTKVSVKYTYYGDSNLDGIVNALDFNALATNYGDTPSNNPNNAVWAKGDYNYDGSVDSTDFGILANNFGKALPGSADLPEDGSLPADGAQSLGPVVPEPASLALLAIGGAAIGTRRKRR